MNIMQKAAELIEKRIPFALATVTASRGSTPRSTAAKMIVLKDKTIFDTIGGGIVEAKVIDEAAAAIAEGKPRKLEYRLNNKVQGGLDMLCGGDLDVFIDVYNANPHVVIVGGGHVGYALAKAVILLGWEYSVIEEREDYSSDQRFESARNIYRSGDLEVLSNIEFDENTYIVIVTKDHDKESLKRIIQKSQQHSIQEHFIPAYIGMIGSRRKVKIVFDALAAEGIPSELLNKVYAPVGLDIGAETPEEIAISIVSEMIKIKNAKTGKSLSDLR